MSAFDHYLHAVLLRAADEARLDGSATTDAHHLLLALATTDSDRQTGRQPDTAARLLAAAGLDRDAVRAALDREFEHSLRTVGVSPDAHGLPAPTPGGERPRLGASSKLAMERGFTAARKKDLTSAHLLLGVLCAEVGTVPRALALSGVDRTGLARRAQAAIDRRETDHRRTDD
ncbi:Clp protease N-terminal domain-containing protein [Kitasatospora sp. NPDC057198]|uniref:Clp protease N-terminal domain-containing protein n=1 Tax=Kitasatospora sp. NPDC057198 TaxID=3346046 RepID=UPI00363E9914